jgi:hypothetical protein
MGQDFVADCLILFEDYLETNGYEIMWRGGHRMDPYYGWNIRMPEIPMRAGWAVAEECQMYTMLFDMLSDFAGATLGSIRGTQVPPEAQERMKFWRKMDSMRRLSAVLARFKRRHAGPTCPYKRRRTHV